MFSYEFQFFMTSCENQEYCSIRHMEYSKFHSGIFGRMESALYFPRKRLNRIWNIFHISSLKEGRLSPTSGSILGIVPDPRFIVKNGGSKGRRNVGSDKRNNWSGKIYYVLFFFLYFIAGLPLIQHHFKLTFPTLAR